LWTDFRNVLPIRGKWCWLYMFVIKFWADFKLKIKGFIKQTETISKFQSFVFLSKPVKIDYKCLRVCFTALFNDDWKCWHFWFWTSESNILMFYLFFYSTFGEHKLLLFINNANAFFRLRTKQAASSRKLKKNHVTLFGCSIRLSLPVKIV